ncbi:hypothetical protein K3N28_03510 [Glycomyces sp. TRM65418]|uniref:hypothetical protein n=1 Tax=Glycomyces sp. TRM65418 TaxID=2867006 RepID=UPI001CE55D39|nr:hypothetical protein [Glycomyces sp. TRM65418]MCC3762139.1 hypothetical protein [Glycomyces sp. TRM65418]QZD56203.1 hypothetical protein K3N28_03490 [Glycomyces sp. TRM65418]
MNPSNELESQANQPFVEWTVYDAHLHYTCAAVQDLRQTGLQGWNPVPTMARTDPGEFPLAEGPATPMYYQAAGDGSYQQSGMFAFGSAGFVAGMFAVNAVANSAARRKAQADLQRRWMPAPPGVVMVSQTRALFWNPNENYSLYWDGLDMIDLTGPDSVMFRYKGVDTGLDTVVQFQTLWAVLIFALACHAAFPNHPRWRSGEWLPVGFEDRCAAAGHPRPEVR